MVSLSDLPGIDASNSRIRNGIVGCAYVFLVLMVIGAASPAEDDTDPASSAATETPTDTPSDDEQTTAASSAATTEAPETTQAPETEAESSGGSSDDSSSSSGYQVRISYDGDWSGSLGAGGSVRSVDGSGTETFDIEEDDPFVVSANAQKQDSGSGELTVQILEDGEVVSEQSTSAEYGVAQTST